MPNYSVIIPTLNEAAEIAACLADLAATMPGAPVIVADGGSHDATVALAEEHGATVVSAPRGRGVQLNAGAQVAASPLLLFLHADTRLPRNAASLITTAFADPKVQLAKFRLGFDEADPLLALAARLMWADSVWSNFGDQGLVIRRSFFRQIGGFPNWPLFEDVRLFEQARLRAPVYLLPGTVRTSARRFRQHGSLNQLAFDTWCMARYLLGTPPEHLRREYEDRRPPVQPKEDR